MLRSISHPFIYGRPVQHNEFLGREIELQTIFNRLRKHESIAIIGEPHIGKSSLLLKLAHQDTIQTYLGEDAGSIVISLLDLHPAGNDYEPTIFWEEALSPLWKYYPDQLKQITEQNYSRRSLENFFLYLNQQDQHLLLLLDEFERLLIHPNFQDPGFFALLRSLATRTNGLYLVVASRLSVMDMIKHGRSLLELGSPFFNHLIELRLKPFSDRTIDLLLNQTDGLFAAGDTYFIRSTVGRHPFLLQAMAATLLETEGEGEERHVQAAENLYHQALYHFDELWQMLDDRARTGIVALALMQLGKRALKDKYSAKSIREIEVKIAPELYRLEAMGLVKRVDSHSEQEFFPISNKKWALSTPMVVRWVHDVVITGAHHISTYDKWLEGKKFRFLLPKERWDSLIILTKNGVDWAVKLVPLIQLFLPKTP